MTWQPLGEVGEEQDATSWGPSILPATLQDVAHWILSAARQSGCFVSFLQMWMDAKILRSKSRSQVTQLVSRWVRLYPGFARFGIFVLFHLALSMLVLKN